MPRTHIVKRRRKVPYQEGILWYSQKVDVMKYLNRLGYLLRKYQSREMRRSKNFRQERKQRILMKLSKALKRQRNRRKRRLKAVDMKFLTQINTKIQRAQMIPLKWITILLLEHLEVKIRNTLKAHNTMLKTKKTIVNQHKSKITIDPRQNNKIYSKKEEVLSLTISKLILITDCPKSSLRNK